MNTRQFIYLLFLTELILSGFWYAGSAVTAMFLIVAGVAAYCAMHMQKSFQVYTLSKLMLLHLCWLVVVAWLSDVPETAHANLAILAGLPVMYLFATNTLTFVHIWRYLRTALFVMSVVLALWAIWQVFFNIGNGRAQGPFQDRNLFAALTNLLWFPAAYLFLSAYNKHKSRQIVLGVGLFIVSAGLFATTSRGGIATWLLLLPVLVWAAYRYLASWQRIAWMLLIAALAYLCSGLLLNATIAERTFTLNQDPSFSARLMLWQSSLNMLLAHPFFGSGWGTFINYYPAYRVPQEYTTAGMFAHNDYLQLAVEGGIPALLLQLCILSGVLIQLKRILWHKFNDVAFESLTLLLGVLALFIHALVNFIFYQAVMNIVAGLYLARAAQMTDKGIALSVLNFNPIKRFLKHLFAVAVIVFISLPYPAHLLGVSINNKRNIKIEHLVSDQFNAYRLAELITAIQPQERVSQETILQTAEQALENPVFINKMGDDFYRQLLNATLQRFDAVRALNANEADLGVRQANMLMRHQAAFEQGLAYKNAHHVLYANLKANPYHVDSIVTLSRLQRLQQKPEAALHTLMHARMYIHKKPDNQLLNIESLRQAAAPEVISELNDLEIKIRRAQQNAKIGKPLQLPRNFYEDIDVRLNAIADQLQHQLMQSHIYSQ